MLEPRLELKPEATVENRDIPTNYIRGIMSAPSMNEKEGVPMMLAMAIMRDRFFVELRTKRSLTYAPGAGFATTSLITHTLHFTHLLPIRNKHFR